MTVIVEVNQSPVDTAAEVGKRVDQTPEGSAVLFKVNRTAGTGSSPLNDDKDSE